jgi:hypothetical protein
MKILYIMKRDIDDTLKKIMDVHKQSHEVRVIDLRKNKDYKQVIELIEKNDKVISW